jgi:hypothetical protein
MNKRTADRGNVDVDLVEGRVVRSGFAIEYYSRISNELRNSSADTLGNAFLSLSPVRRGARLVRAVWWGWWL